MNELELMSMIVRIVGDTQQYQSSIQQSAQVTQQAAKQVEASAGAVQSFSSTLKGFAATVGASLGALGIFNFLSGARQAYEEFDRSQKQLNVTMEMNGGNVKERIEDYKKFAKAIADVTTTSAGEVFSMVKQAETYGLVGDQAKAAVKNAVALSGALGGEAAAYIRGTVSLAQGNPAYLMRMLRLRGIKNEAEALAKIQDILGKGFKAAEVAGQSNEAKIARLWRTLSGLKREIGGIISEAIQPLISAGQRAAEWFNSLDPKVRKNIVTIGALTASFIALRGRLGFLTSVASLFLGPLKLVTGAVASLPSLWATVGMSVANVANLFRVLSTVLGTILNPVRLFYAAWSGISTVITTVISVLGVVLGPVGLLLAAVVAIGAALYIWVDSVGGVANAWEIVKQKAIEFWEYIEPIRKALVSLFVTIWETGKAAFTSLGNFVMSVWKDIGLSGVINWDKIRDVIVDTILFAEFTIKNFGQVVSFVWSSILYGFVRFANQVEYFFKDVLPAVGSWFAENWRDIITDVWNWTKTVFSNLATNIGEIFSNLPAILSGKMKISDLWTPLAKGFQRVSKELVLPDRIEGELEKQLRIEFEMQGEALNKSWEEFKKSKLAEFALGDKDTVDTAKNDALNVGKGIGENLGKGLKQGKDKFDAALFRSAEGLQRIEAQRERFNPTLAEKQTKSEGYLKDIRDILKEKKNDGLMIEETDLEEEA